MERGLGRHGAGRHRSQRKCHFFRGRRGKIPILDGGESQRREKGAVQRRVVRNWFDFGPGCYVVRFVHPHHHWGFYVPTRRRNILHTSLASLARWPDWRIGLELHERKQVLRLRSPNRFGSDSSGIYPRNDCHGNRVLWVLSIRNRSLGCTRRKTSAAPLPRR